VMNLENGLTEIDVTFKIFKFTKGE
jgi:hypothetical protein